MNSVVSKFCSRLRGSQTFAPLLLLLLLTAGCNTTEYAARMITKAPNLHDKPLSEKRVDRIWAKYTTTNASEAVASLVRFEVIVGPPYAELRGIEVRPRDYHKRVSVKLDPDKKGIDALTVKAVPETNDTFTPLPEPRTIILLHGYSAAKEMMAPWALMLAQAGYRVVAVDLRGHGLSSGAQVSFGKYETADLSQVLDYLIAEQLCEPRVGVLGISFGGVLAMHWAARDPRVAAVVAIAPYNHFRDALIRFAKALNVWFPRGILDDALALAAKNVGIQWEDWSGEAGARQLKIPVLLVGGGKDTISTPEDIARLKSLAPVGSEAITVPQADHFAVSYWFKETAAPIKEWFRSHLEENSKAQ